MKPICLLATLLLSFASVNAQIGEVKKDGTLLRIYDEKGNNTGLYVSLCSSCDLAGYNSDNIVVNEGTIARIYDANGNNTGSYVSLCSGCYVKNVTKSAILVKEGSVIRYYNFSGNFLYYTND